MAQSGQIRQRISESQLIGLLDQVEQAQGGGDDNRGKITVSLRDGLVERDRHVFLSFDSFFLSSMRTCYLTHSLLLFNVLFCQWNLEINRVYSSTFNTSFGRFLSTLVRRSFKTKTTMTNSIYEWVFFVRFLMQDRCLLGGRGTSLDQTERSIDSTSVQFNWLSKNNRIKGGLSERRSILSLYEYGSVILENQILGFSKWQERAFPARL